MQIWTEFNTVTKVCKWLKYVYWSIVKNKNFSPLVRWEILLSHIINWLLLSLLFKYNLHFVSEKKTKYG